MENRLKDKIPKAVQTYQQHRTSTEKIVTKEIQEISAGEKDPSL
jgi:hypothetical protein